MRYPDPLNDVIEGLTRISGVGYKTAERYAFNLLDMPDHSVLKLAKSLIDLKRDIKECSICNIYTTEDVCDICSNKNRNNKSILVVEDTKDVVSFEKLKTYNGKYHVLGGVISPLNGISIDDLQITSLLERLKEPQIDEVILALNSTQEGEATTSFIYQKLKNIDSLKVTKLAQGIPIGSDIEYADNLTIIQAFNGRREI